MIVAEIVSDKENDGKTFWIDRSAKVDFCLYLIDEDSYSFSLIDYNENDKAKFLFHKIND